VRQTLYQLRLFVLILFVLAALVLPAVSVGVLALFELAPEKNYEYFLVYHLTSAKAYLAIGRFYF
jgi:hypothetical protein